MKHEIMPAEEARKIATEVRNDKGMVEARQQLSELIKDGVKIGNEEILIFGYEKLDNRIWQELEDLGYTVTQEITQIGEGKIVRWG